MTRTALPDRRPSLTLEAEFKGHPIAITIGFDLTGAPREVFADNHKSGSDMQASLADACVIISIALQHGIPAEALGRSLGRVPVFLGEDGATGPASPLGVIVAALGEFA